MKLRAPGTGDRNATCILILAMLSLVMPVGCAFQNPWREKLSRADDIPAATEPAMWLEYESAMAVSRKTGKPVVLFFTGSDWCPWCVRLHEEVFDTDEFREWAADRVTMVDVDFPQKSQLSGDRRVLNETLKKTYDDRIQGFPTALFIDANGNVLGRLGYEGGGPKPWITKAGKFVTSNTL